MNFVFSVVNVLTIASCLFPGRKVGLKDVRLHFPSLTRIVSAQGTTSIVPRSALAARRLLRLHLGALGTRGRDRFLDCYGSGTTHVRVPKNGVRCFSTFFSTLRGTRGAPLQVVRCNSSRLRNSHVSSMLHRTFRRGFKNGNIKLVPTVRAVPACALSRSTGPRSVPHRLVCNPGRVQLSRKQSCKILKRAAAIASAAIDVAFSAQDERACPGTSGFQVFALVANGGIRTSIVANGSALSLRRDVVGRGCCACSVSFGALHANLAMLIGKDTSVCNVALSNSGKISLSGVPVQKYSNAVFANVDRTALSPFFARGGIRLVVLRCKKGSIPCLGSDRSVARCVTTLGQRVGCLEEVTPGIRVLFVKPSSVTAVVGKRVRACPVLPSMIRTLGTVTGRTNVTC